MEGDLASDHVALALADLRHIGSDATGRGAELRCMVHQLRHLCTPDLVLAGQARNVGTGAPNPSPLHNGGPPPRACEVPSKQLPSLSAAEDHSVEPLRFGHVLPPHADSDG